MGFHRKIGTRSCSFTTPFSMAVFYMQALGLCTLIIGLQGVLPEEHILLLIVSLVTGVFIGEYGDWGGINRDRELGS